MHPLESLYRGKKIKEREKNRSFHKLQTYCRSDKKIYRVINFKWLDLWIICYDRYEIINDITAQTYLKICV